MSPKWYHSRACANCTFLFAAMNTDLLRLQPRTDASRRPSTANTNPFAPSRTITHAPFSPPSRQKRVTRRRLRTYLSSHAFTVCSRGLFGTIGGPIGSLVGLALAPIVGAAVFGVIGTFANMARSRTALQAWCLAAGISTAVVSFWSLSGFAPSALWDLSESLVVSACVAGSAACLAP